MRLDRKGSVEVNFVQGLQAKRIWKKDRMSNQRLNPPSLRYLLLISKMLQSKQLQGQTTSLPQSS